MLSRTRLNEFKTYTMRELNQHTAQVIDEINSSQQPGVITKHGHFVALITPLRDHNIEEVVLSQGELGTEIDRRAAETGPVTHSSTEVLDQWRARH
jgi:antitoxin (DNA-binding transcriptional repressor) of toxin-antitoxin stability system